jgi:hypothetical protein
MLERVDAAICGDRGELADPGIDRLGAPLDIGIVAERALREGDALANLGEPSKRRLTKLGARVDARLPVARGFRRMPLDRR